MRHGHWRVGSRRVGSGICGVRRGGGRGLDGDDAERPGKGVLALDGAVRRYARDDHRADVEAAELLATFARLMHCLSSSLLLISQLELELGLAWRVLLRRICG